MMHLQRIKNVVLEIFLVRKPGNLADHFTQYDIPGIVVLKSHSWSMSERNGAKRLHQLRDADVSVFRGSYPIFRLRIKPCGVIEQLPDRHLLVYAIWRAEFHQISAHRAIKIDSSFVLQLHQRQRGECFAHGCDQKGSLRRHWAF
ncbi:MAG: hypothetical protein M5R40_12060 [Anaerolineae bacterium]|nr:hypothetical protein [Anaerolineae bacterium]